MVLLQFLQTKEKNLLKKNKYIYILLLLLTIDHPKHIAVKRKSLEQVFMHMHLHLLNFYRATRVKLYYAVTQTQIISNTVTRDVVKHSSKNLQLIMSIGFPTKAYFTS